MALELPPFSPGPVPCPNTVQNIPACDINRFHSYTAESLVLAQLLEACFGSGHGMVVAWLARRQMLHPCSKPQVDIAFSLLAMIRMCLHAQNAEF